MNLQLLRRISSRNINSRKSILFLAGLSVGLISILIPFQDSSLGTLNIENAQAISSNNPWVIPTIQEYHDPNWLYGFKICPDLTIENGIILISSDLSDMSLDINKTIESGTCKSFSVAIPANDPESIFVSIIEV